MIVAQISDTHISLDAPDAEQRTRDLAVAVADINTLDPSPDLIIHTGDIAQNGRPEEYALAAATLAKAHRPVYVAAGNKDNRANLRRAFGATACPVADDAFIDYAVDGYPARLIALDTLSSRSNKGDFCPERAERLFKLIDAERSMPIAVFMHHPPFVVTVGPDPVHFETPEAMARLQQALQRSGRVIAIFTGHVHRSTAGQVGNIPAKVTPCIATALRKGDYPAHLKHRPVYQLHRYDPDCGFLTETRIAGLAA
jgi:3',5'-cyclic-AMP phosphodiesterase